MRALVKYDSDARAYRFADVVELTHPAPRDARQGALFRYARDRRHDRAGAVPAELPCWRQQAVQVTVSSRQRICRVYVHPPSDRHSSGGSVFGATSAPATPARSPVVRSVNASRLSRSVLVGRIASPFLVLLDRAGSPPTGGRPATVIEGNACLMDLDDTPARDPKNIERFVRAFDDLMPASRSASK